MVNIEKAFKRFEDVCGKGTLALEDFKFTILKLGFRTYCKEDGRLPISEDKLVQWYENYWINKL